VRQEEQTRAGLVVVELGEEGTQHLGRLQRRIGLGEIGAVAPVLPGAEEEHLDAALAALLVDGEDVRLLDALRVDALVRLDMGKGGEPVAVDRGALEVELLGCRLHGSRDFRLYLAGCGRTGNPSPRTSSA
jgi:hypothetical protein